MINNIIGNARSNSWIKTINNFELDHFIYTFACNKFSKPLSRKASFEMPRCKTKQFRCSKKKSHIKKRLTSRSCDKWILIMELGFEVLRFLQWTQCQMTLYYQVSCSLIYSKHKRCRVAHDHAQHSYYLKSLVLKNHNMFFPSPWLNYSILISDSGARQC